MRSGHGDRVQRAMRRELFAYDANPPAARRRGHIQAPHDKVTASRYQANVNGKQSPINKKEAESEREVAPREHPQKKPPSKLATRKAVLDGKHDAGSAAIRSEGKKSALYHTGQRHGLQKQHGSLHEKTAGKPTRSLQAATPTTTHAKPRRPTLRSTQASPTNQRHLQISDMAPIADVHARTREAAGPASRIPRPIADTHAKAGRKYRAMFERMAEAKYEPPPRIPQSAAARAPATRMQASTAAARITRPSVTAKTRLSQQARGRGPLIESKGEEGHTAIAAERMGQLKKTMEITNRGHLPALTDKEKETGTKKVRFVGVAVGEKVKVIPILDCT